MGLRALTHREAKIGNTLPHQMLQSNLKYLSQFSSDLKESNFQKNKLSQKRKEIAASEWRQKIDHNDLYKCSSITFFLQIV